MYQQSLFPNDNEHHNNVESLVELMLDPVGRAQRRKVVAVRCYYDPVSDLPLDLRR